MDTQLPVRSSLRDFLYVLFKRKVQILLFFFATVCTVTIGTFLMKPTYEATSNPGQNRPGKSVRADGAQQRQQPGHQPQPRRAAQL